MVLLRQSMVKDQVSKPELSVPIVISWTQGLALVSACPWGVLGPLSGAPCLCPLTGLLSEMKALLIVSETLPVAFRLLTLRDSSAPQEATSSASSRAETCVYCTRQL